MATERMARLDEKGEADVALFTEADLISVYTRRQGLADGVLVDVTDTAREAGFICPVAVTASVWSAIEDIPARYRGWQDWKGRLWDVLWMAKLAAWRERTRFMAGERIEYVLLLSVGRKSKAALVVQAGSGDDGETVVTIMAQGED